MKKEPFLQVSKRRNKARWQERLLIRFIALILALIVCGAVIVALVKMNPVDVYKAIWDGAMGSERRLWQTIRDTMVLLCISIGRSLNMEDIDLCRMLTNILENAVEGCQKVSEEQRIIRLNLHSKGNFLFIKCENSCNEDNLRITNGKYKSSKKNSDKHGYGLKIINGIAEKYNGILNVQVRGGFFAVTTTLCLDENND